MSVENATAFYEVLVSDQDVYEQYCKKCSQQGVFGVWNWDKTKIVNFASKLGFDFTEGELDRVWFETDSDSTENSIKTPTYSSF